MRGIWVAVIALLATAAVRAQEAGPVQVEINLEEQRAYLLAGHHVLLASPISSGRQGHLTGTGSFKVIEKEQNHFSSIYGRIVDRNGNTIVADADADMKVPPGGKFIPAPMRYFMRFHGADGMHAGYLPGYPASHGCVRMPEQYAVAFFNAIQVGTPVRVIGQTTASRQPYGAFPPLFGNQRSLRYRTSPDQEPVYEALPYDPRRDPRYDPRFIDPWWR